MKSYLMIHHFRIVALSSILLTFSCGSPVPGTDGGTDSGSVITGGGGAATGGGFAGGMVGGMGGGSSSTGGGSQIDSGMADIDSGSPDAGVDAGIVDAGLVDAGCVSTRPDIIDIDGIDSDCDGADGEASKTLYVSTLGVDRNPGTARLPVATVPQALTLARQNLAFRDVLIAESTTPYAARGVASLLASNVNVYGGYNATNWNRPMGIATSASATMLEVARNGETVFGSDAGVATVLSDVELRVNDALPVPVGWVDSIVLVVNNAPNLTLKRVNLVATDGGTPPLPPDAGATGFDGGFGLAPNGGENRCGSSTGFLAGGKAGELPTSISVNNLLFFLGKFGDGPVQLRGGAPASINPQSPGDQYGTAGTVEAFGGSLDGGFDPLYRDAGTQGGPVVYSLDQTGSIRTSVAVNPARGRAGSGGGGGRSCAVSSSTYTAGGGGGSGGCPGAFGLLGFAGGHSIGLIITGAGPLLDSVKITVGNGGNGGQGSSGGRGGNGGNGGNALGVCQGNSNPATGGGGGASGGGGGGGTGGHGGMAVGILYKLGPEFLVRRQNVTVTRGSGGIGGLGGVGGMPGAPGLGGLDGRGANGARAQSGAQNLPSETGRVGTQGVSTDFELTP